MNKDCILFIARIGEKCSKSDTRMLARQMLTLVLLYPDIPCLYKQCRSRSDQLASEEANCSGSALFAIKYVNL